MKLVEIATAAIVALSPGTDPGELAADVALAATVAPHPFDGPASAEASTLALVAIAWHESGFRPDVADCRVCGDTGRSITAFQLMRGWAWGEWEREDLCRSQSLAAVMALRVLEQHGQRCRGGSWRQLFDGYASGSCGRPSHASRRLCAIWARLARDAGLEGATCHGRRRPIAWNGGGA